jgi:hypothetical protein
MNRVNNETGTSEKCIQCVALSDDPSAGARGFIALTLANACFKASCSCRSISSWEFNCYDVSGADASVSFGNQGRDLALELTNGGDLNCSINCALSSLWILK